MRVFPLFAGAAILLASSGCADKEAAAPEMAPPVATSPETPATPGAPVPPGAPATLAGPGGATGGPAAPSDHGAAPPAAPPGPAGAMPGVGAPGPGGASSPDLAAAAARLVPTPELDQKIADLENRDGDKKALAAAYTDRGWKYMENGQSAPRVLYRSALKDFRTALVLDPANARAAKAKQTIEKIYEGMGMPVPQ